MQPNPGPLAPAETANVALKPFGFFNYITIAIYWFALSFLWGGFLSVVLPALNKPVAESVFGPNKAEVARGILTSLGLLIAIIVQPVAGAISDRSSRSALGDDGLLCWAARR